MKITKLLENKAPLMLRERMTVLFLLIILLVQKYFLSNFKHSVPIAVQDPPDFLEI